MGTLLTDLSARIASAGDNQASTQAKKGVGNPFAPSKSDAIWSRRSLDSNRVAKHTESKNKAKALFNFMMAEGNTELLG